ncbi:hypothetical protein AcW1_005615 [Taiwanofungus camphoratus]|nr:hypothetical protein AcW1_005615 [Antrodia cinnamomea]
MSRTSAYLWKAARANVEGLPECPSYLSEPQYANLVFSPHCHNCLKSKIHSILWVFNVRYCSTCKKTLITTSVSLPTSLSGRASHMNLLNHLWERRGKLVFHVQQVSKVTLRWINVMGNEENAKQFVDEQSALVKQIREHSNQCEIWLASRARSRAVELDGIRNMRLETIVSRLRELGWGEDLDILQRNRYFPLIRHPHVRQAKELTDRVWQNIRGDMEALMEKVRTRRHEDERKDLLRARLKMLLCMISGLHLQTRRTLADEYKPAFVDYAIMPKFRQIVEAPSNDSITINNFLAHRDLVPELDAQWQAGTKAQLANLIKEKIDVPENVEPLDLAVAYFKCDNCQALARYPQVIAHKCLRSSGSEWAMFEELLHSVAGSQHGDPYERLAVSVGHISRWSCNNLTIDSTMELVQGILLACGKDPRTTTRQEMDNLDVRLCQRSFDGRGIKKVMHWRTAASTLKVLLLYSYIRFQVHIKYALDYVEMEDLIWDVANEDETRVAKQLEANCHARLSRDYWCCSLCTNWDGRYRNMTFIREHLQTKHSIEDPSTENGDMYFHPDGDDGPPPKVLLIPETLSVGALFAIERQWLEDGRACFYPFPV